MPTPIQSSSITNKLRSFFRLRGRQIFTLDETSVPVVIVEDLTTAPYRENHQVRFSIGVVKDLVAPSGAARDGYVLINTTPIGTSPVSLAPVSGVAVIESLTIQAVTAMAPAGSVDLIVEYRTHQAMINSLDPFGANKRQGTNVDTPSAGIPSSTVVTGQVPIAMTGAQSLLVPALGTGLTINRLQVPDNRAILEVLNGRQVVIGDNVAVLIRTVPQITSGSIAVNMRGSYYPLART